MLLMLNRLANTWSLVTKRSVSHWKLLISVVVGVMLASTIMSGTVIYFDALRELALKSTLARLTDGEVDILIKTERGPTTYEEYGKVYDLVNGEVSSKLDWMLTARIEGGRSATFFLTYPGEEEKAGKDDARAFFTFSSDFEDRINIISGGWSESQSFTSDSSILVLEAVIPEEAADLFNVQVGDSLSVVPYWDDKISSAKVVISGIFSKIDSKDPYWHLDKNVFRSTTEGSFRAVPFYISKEKYMEVLGAGFEDMNSTYGWLLDVDPDLLNAENATTALSYLASVKSRLATDLFSYRQVTALEDTLSAYDKRLFYSKLPMFVVLVLIAAVILYYVITISSLLVEQQRGEIALLRSRGATPIQILTVFIFEGATISIAAIIIAPIIAAIIVSLTGFTPVFSTLSDGSRLAVKISSSAYVMAVLGGLLSFLALLIPAFQASRTEVTSYRQSTSRPPGQSLFQRYYLDILLLVVSIILFQRLTEQGSVVAVGVFGELAVNQLLLAVPALVLFAFAAVMLRLFPLALRYISGDSPILMHLIINTYLLLFLASIFTEGITNSISSDWLINCGYIFGLIVLYWITQSVTRFYQIAGFLFQLIVVAIFLWVNNPLSAHEYLSLSALLIVPFQILFKLLQVFSKRAPAGYLMGLLHMARNPTHYARLCLLMVLMAGLGIFAASFGGTLERSFYERAMYSTGSDVRIEGLVLNNKGSTQPVAESYLDLPNVNKASEVYRGYGSDLSTLVGEGYTMLSVSQPEFGEIAWFREDFSDRSMEELLPDLVQSNLPKGIVLPLNAKTIGLRIKPDRPHSSVAVTVRIKDVNNRYFTYTLGQLRSPDWMEVEAPLERISRWRRTRLLQPSVPLTLVSIAFHEMNTQGRLSPGAVIIDEVRVTTDKGLEVIEDFEDIQPWNRLSATPDAKGDSFNKVKIGIDGKSEAPIFSWTDGHALVSRGIYHGPPIPPLPVLASTSFLKSTGHQLGDEIQVSVAGNRILIRLHDEVKFFPTTNTIHENHLVSDLSSLASIANLPPRGSEVRPNEIWISTKGSSEGNEELIETLSDGQPYSHRVIIDRKSELERSKLDPLVQAGWKVLLFIAFFSILILSSLGFLVHSYVSFRSRESQFGLMRTLGFSMRQLIVLVWVEQALVIIAGMLIGTWMGGRLGQIIMPFLAHDDKGAEVIPPFILDVDGQTLVLTYLAMSVVFTIIIFGMILFVRKISLHRILRMGGN